MPGVLRAEGLGIVTAAGRGGCRGLVRTGFGPLCRCLRARPACAGPAGPGADLGRAVGPGVREQRPHGLSRSFGTGACVGETQASARAAAASAEEQKVYLYRMVHLEHSPTSLCFHRVWIHKGLQCKFG